MPATFREACGLVVPMPTEPAKDVLPLLEKAFAAFSRGTLLAAIPLSAICPAVPVKLTRFPEVTPLVGPVVIPEPLPARVIEDVMVVAEPAIATCPLVIPLIAPVVEDEPEVDA